MSTLPTPPWQAVIREAQRKQGAIRPQDGDQGQNLATVLGIFGIAARSSGRTFIIDGYTFTLHYFKAWDDGTIRFELRIERQGIMQAVGNWDVSQPRKRPADDWTAEQAALAEAIDYLNQVQTAGDRLLTAMRDFVKESV